MACGCDKRFPNKYLLLKPQEVGFYDLFKILFSSNLEKVNSVHSPMGADEEQSFERRWLIFVSILVQKCLQLVSKPLACFGSCFEFWLNLLSTNHNIFVLVLNFLQGKVTMPDKASAGYLSLTAILDKRVELDSSIKHGDRRYNAALSMMAAKVSYENTAYIETIVRYPWKMDFVGSYDFWNEFQGKATTQGFILLDRSEESDTYVVAFRGTEPFDADAYCSDFDISWYHIPGVGKIHGGFMKALGLQKDGDWPKEIERDESHPPVAYYAIRDILRERLAENPKARFIVTGHSMGGSFSILFVAILILHDEKFLLERVEGVYTFGQPRVGDETFAKYMEEKLTQHRIRYYRIVYCNDVVPRLPYDNRNLMFKHFGTCVYYNRCFEGKIVEEEPNKNYFSPLAAISKSVNALLELIRSFTIAYKYGSDYEERWLLILFRILGLVIPGLPAHFTQNYVNATRLGSVNALT